MSGSQERKNNSDDNLFSKFILWWKKRRAEQKKEKAKPQTFAESLLSWAKTILGAIIVVMIINGLAIASFVVPTGSMENTVMTGDFLFVNKFVYGPSTPQVIPFLNIPLPFYKFPGIKDPERGDVIVFIYPGDRDEATPREFQYYLKRCVAVAGDTLEIRNKMLYINNEEVDLTEYARYDYSVPVPARERWLTNPPGRGYTRDDYGPVRIPKEGDTLWLNDRNWSEWEYFIKKEGSDVYLLGPMVYVDDKPTEFYIVKRNYCFGLGDNRDHSQDSRFWGFVPYENVVGTPIIVYWSWETKDVFEQPLGFFQKLGKIRWSRIFKLID